ncbi:YhgE/Pip domain-containing protein [Microlunatus aurantiacus]|uniref:YhgE/Pip domain-containing protein n=1 Tax=Microlunatus aurantiacus TaxID=446786 RepID=A0ABP7CX93_9ACTN
MKIPVPASRLARFELRRFRGTMPRLALVFVLIVPALYGAIYLSANWDPYGKLGHLPVAVVDADRPTTFENQTITAGADFVSELKKGAAFEYHDVDETEAQRGLRQGDYYLVISVPADFSADLVSGAGDDPQRAKVMLYRNDANGFVVGSITSSAQNTIARAVDEAAEVAYFNAVFANLTKIRTGLESARKGAAELAAGLTTAEQGATKLHAGTGRAVTGANRLATGATSLAAGLDTAETGSADLASGLRTLKTGTAKLSTGADQVAAGTQKLDDEVVPVLDDVLEVLPKAQADAKSLNTTLNRIGKAVGSGSATVGSDIDAASDALDAAIKANPDLADETAIRRLSSALDTAGKRADTVADDVDSGLDRVNALDRRLQSNQLPTKVRSARDNLVKLNSGAQEVAKGASSVQSGTASASAGADKLATGIASASAGADTLSTGAASLATGVKQLDTGAAELETGLTRLRTGAGKLEAGLADGIKRIPALSGEEQSDAVQVLASPADVSMQVLNPATYYGRGLAPLFFAIALWVFGISVFLVVRPITGRALAGRASPVRLALTGWLPIGGIAVAGGLLMAGIVWVLLGLDPVHPFGFLGLLVLAACCFSAIAHLLRTALGTAGSSLLLVLLILQLASTGGTYPTPLLPGFFAAIGPAMPMTYLIDGFRVVISGGELSHLARDVAVLAGILVATTALTVLVVSRRQGFSMKDLHPPLVSP